MIALLAALLGVMPSPAHALAEDSTVYVLSPETQVEVHVGRSGMLRFLGHEHLIRARGVTGRIVYYPRAPTASRVAITVAAPSLEVLTPPDSTEIRQVTEVMRSQVLAVTRYPEITFASRAVTPIAGGYRVRGALSIVGVSRDVTVDVAVAIQPDTLRATARFAVKQRDYGIEPVRAGGGTVGVADRVAIDGVIVAVRERPEGAR